MNKQGERDIKKAARIKTTAEIVGVTPRSVRRVLNAEQENETVLTVFMELTEGENKLVEAVKNLIPFN